VGILRRNSLMDKASHGENQDPRCHAITIMIHSSTHDACGEDRGPFPPALTSLINQP